jgi:hypothetical protein
MEPPRIDLAKNFLFLLPDPPGEVAHVVRTQLRTLSTALNKSSTVFGVMTATCERVHVV